MKISFYKIVLLVFLALGIQFFSLPVFAADFNKDLYIGDNDISFKDEILKGDMVRIYVTVHSSSSSDLSGVVKFYDEKNGVYVGSDQPVSVLSNKTDDVFTDWIASSVGDHQISIRLVPWITDGDNPDNNKVIKTIYVDIDSDHDGIGDRVDPDDDNDGHPDAVDAFPADPKEWKDTDGDGIGDNEDMDDDNDGSPDIQDVFPLDKNESKDTDGDKIGDNADKFPYDPTELADSDNDGLGDNADPNDQNAGPAPSIEVAKTDLKIGEPVTFNAIKSRDPDGEVVKFEWDFGDGGKDTGVITDHTFTKAGQYMVTLRATDDKGESREQQIQISVRSKWLLIALICTTILLIILILGLLLKDSPFYYKKFRGLTDDRKPKQSASRKKL